MSESTGMEVWAGAEYTCNRVGDRYFDQMELSGHAHRLQDIELFASLGIQALRCGLLWERHEYDLSWNWSDAYLERIRNSGMRPIAGLVHHGSGPRNTSLRDPGFPDKLASYAGAVAQRYPWIRDYTPINEPNTTARFSSMYGIWYPHEHSRRSYLRALLLQLKATVLSMRAIREVRSDAQLIQTEDVGHIWSTSELAPVANLLNERRWLGFDLLSGTVDRIHPSFRYMHDAGISDEEIFWFQDNPCPPSTIGINYYVTSERFIDHRVDLYSSRLRSAEGPFVDLEAVRIRPEGISGFESVLVEAATRCGTPVALTEVHLGDNVEQQIRWVMEAWQGAERARGEGVNCVATTLWALLGSYFWNELVTVDNGNYEPGVFDMSHGEPRATDLAQVVRDLAAGRQPTHPALTEQGWWRRPERLLFEPPSVNDPQRELVA